MIKKTSQFCWYEMGKLRIECSVAINVDPPLDYGSAIIVDVQE